MKKRNKTIVIAVFLITIFLLCLLLFGNTISVIVTGRPIICKQRGDFDYKGIHFNVSIYSNTIELAGEGIGVSSDDFERKIPLIVHYYNDNGKTETLTDPAFMFEKIPSNSKVNVCYSYQNLSDNDINYIIFDGIEIYVK